MTDVSHISLEYMSERFEKGDLVFTRSEPSKIGIVVDIILRSSQNTDWDSVLVMFENGPDTFGPRQLQLMEK